MLQILCSQPRGKYYSLPMTLSQQTLLADMNEILICIARADVIKPSSVCVQVETNQRLPVIRSSFVQKLC